MAAKKATKKAVKKATKKAATKRASKITLKDDTLYVLSGRGKMLTWQPVSVFETYEQAAAERDSLPRRRGEGSGKDEDARRHRGRDLRGRDEQEQVREDQADPRDQYPLTDHYDGWHSSRSLCRLLPRY